MPIQCLASYQIQDADRETTSFDLNFVNTTNLLTDILLYLFGNVAPALDLVTDGKLVKVRLSLLVTLPPGIKANAVAGAENERTGLFTCGLANTTKSYGVDVPAFSQGKFNAGSINMLDPGVIGFDTLLTSAYNNCYPTDDKGNEILSIRRARKTFRKHRKALARA